MTIEAKPGLWGVVRRAAGDDNPDCSCGCRWARWLKGALGNDWCVCANPLSPRVGLLMFEHQAGRGCFEREGKHSGGAEG